MTPAVEQLVRDAMDLTGVERPALLGDGAPVLASEVVHASEIADETGFYLVGLIGGKEVGKSALVNALVGSDITAITSHGPGTEIVVAYAHSTRAPALRDMLERVAPGQFRIVTHDAPAVRRQVLLDLPDIDSHYQSHLALTRAMLRYMLFPVWVQSVEKYADAQPRQMLSQVAAGNAAQNFIFCLNKVDQLEPVGGATGPGDHNGDSPGDDEPSAEAIELRDDFAGRLARTLSLPAPPRVFLISAHQPQRYDLPRLKALLAREKTIPALRESRELAGRRQDRSLLDWLASQDLPGRAGRLGRLRHEVEELTAQRLAEPLVDRALPALADDSAGRQQLADEILVDRVARWPLVSLVHTLLAPLLSLLRTMGARHVAPLRGPESAAEFYLGIGPAGGAGGWSAPRAVQATFAHLRQSQPALAPLYGANRLWEDLPADMAAAELARRLAATIERQRSAARVRVARGGGAPAALARWLLTVGALIWFPFAQPVLHELLGAPSDAGWVGWTGARHALGVVVAALGADYLLHSVGFLAVWFLVIWLALRWNTQRQVARLLDRWNRCDDPDPDLTLAATALQWVNDLADPVRRAHERMSGLVTRMDEFDGDFKG